MLTSSRPPSSHRRFIRVAAVVLIVVGTVGLPAVTRANAVPRQANAAGGMHYLGRTNLGALARAHANVASPRALNVGATEIRNEPDRPGRGLLTPPPPTPAPSAANRAVQRSAGGSQSFVGLTGLQQRLADNGNQFSLEPPDQGLCAAHGLIVESVNTALAVYTNAGVQVTAPVSLNEFFGLGPAIDRSHNPPTFGTFISDPRCYYDPQAQRWIHTILAFGKDPYTGAFRAPSAELVAVSQTPDPSAGYSLFSFDTTNDGTNGTPKNPNCPCFGDQPRLGADANGIYISADEYPINGTFDGNGGRLWAISKKALYTATDTGASTGIPQTVPVVSVSLGAKVDGFPANAVQPATTPPGGTYPANKEYFLSTPDFNGFAAAGGSGAKSVLLWTLNNTSSLSSAHPKLTLTRARLASEPYSPPPPVAQKPGPIPLGNAVNEPENTIQSNDDRMQQVVYAGGKVYSTLNTGLGTNGKANRAGAAWFQVTPSAGGGGSVTAQGYISVSGASFIFPAIALTASGSGAIVGTYSGPKSFPSAAFVRFSASQPTGPVVINGSGARPEDGFTCYQALIGDSAKRGCRWGDYSAAVAEDPTHIVMATEFIPNAPRSTFMNWGTLISRVHS
ncbi:MAG: hypothetical protein QOE71_3802 [Pseudonocardiales bacterium]|jgi:hypothetical protein|nr:hypothetical protein [Pseudonocardiales bacterium]